MALHTIVMRFRNYKSPDSEELTDTVGEHLKIINSSDAKKVWWGWWKKDQEPSKANTLEAIKKRCPISVGLVNRLEKKFYSARCVQVKYTASASRPRMKSPDAARTPEYYRDSAHPAWFEFSAIDEVSEEAFVHDFGGIPKGDPTLFVVDKRANQFSLRDKDISVPKIIETQGDSILHLSDLHFGDDHGYQLKTEKEPAPKISLADKIAEIVRPLEDYNIGVVVISGDLLTEGKNQGYYVAEEFLNRLLKHLRLKKEHVVIVPGNHDIEIKDYQTAPYNYEPEVPYRAFLKSYFGSKVDTIERLQHFHTPGDWNLRFLSLNSARLREKKMMEYGLVGKDRYEPLLKIIDEVNDGKSAAELAQDKTLNFAVLHHHVLPVQGIDEPPSDKPVSLTLDAGQLVANLQAAQFHYVLHGHQHVPFVGSTARATYLRGGWTGHDYPLFVIGCGSSGAKVQRLLDALRDNTLGIYTPKGNQLEVRVERFNPGIPSQTYMQFMIR